jgi:hypothetical protein
MNNFFYLNDIYFETMQKSEILKLLNNFHILIIYIKQLKISYCFHTRKSILLGQNTILKILAPIIVLFLLALANFCQGQYLFNNISKQNGLETSGINCIERDNGGFVWIGTGKGLYRFDGTDIIHFKNDPNDSTTISEDVIISLYNSKDGNIWVGTKDKGVNIIDPESLNIQHLYPTGDNSTGLTSVQNCIMYDDGENVLITGSFHGFDIFNKKEKKFTNFKPTNQIHQLQPRLANTFICCAADPADPSVITR